MIEEQPRHHMFSTDDSLGRYISASRRASHSGPYVAERAVLWISEPLAKRKV